MEVFDKAAFYGGTCLRIFYCLDRFSEDLYFALLENDQNFTLDKYFLYLEKEFQSCGILMIVESKVKDENSEIRSAFLKGNTLLLMMSFFSKSGDAKRVVSNKKIKIKFEVDINNPSGGETINKYRMLPSPYEIKIFNESTLFVGKIHAIICREYKNHVKRRDFMIIFFMF